MKMVAEISIELDVPARRMEVADILTWFGTGLMINHEEDEVLEPHSGVIEFAGRIVGKYSVTARPALARSASRTN